MDCFREERIMASSIGNFRSALHGFNRTDVVQFIQSQTMEHEHALRVLREENDRLKDALEQKRVEAEGYLAEKEALAAQLEEILAAAPAAEEEANEAPLPDLDAPMAPTATVVAAAATNFDELELAAYRRAEMTERMARERAAASAERMKTIFSQAEEKLNLTSQDLATMLDAFRNDCEQLQQVLATTRGIVDESSASLKAAAELTSDI